VTPPPSPKCAHRFGNGQVCGKSSRDSYHRMGGGDWKHRPYHTYVAPPLSDGKGDQ
jgi:hypothetical protein